MCLPLPTDCGKIAGRFIGKIAKPINHGETILSIEEETPRRASQQQIWIPLVVGVVMFSVGLFAGYFVRPFISPQAEETETASIPSPPSSGSGQAGNQEVMAFLIRETRHFKGDTDAPVTIIEFSDFK
jgi:hypothetical protein